MKIAIVTGASSGMGREFVTQLESYISVDEIWVIARRRAALEALNGLTRATLRPIPLDLCQQESFETLGALLEAEKPDVKLLVNAAGFGKFGSWDKVSVEDDLKMIDLNCKALVAMTRLVLPYMGANSHVLQLDSLSAFQPVPYLNTYAATKSFVLSYTRGLNRELKGRGIGVTAVCPFWTKTEFFDRAVTDGEPVVKKYVAMYEPDQIVYRAWRDAKRGRDISRFGFKARGQSLLTKILPHSLVMSVWMGQQDLK